MDVPRAVSGVMLAETVWWSAISHGVEVATGSSPAILDIMIIVGLMIAAPFYGYVVSEEVHKWMLHYL